MNETLTQTAMKVLLIIFVLFEVTHWSVALNNPCQLKSTQFGLVCVCTENYCDYLENPIPQTNNEAHIISSSKSGLRFSTQIAQFNIGRQQQINDYINVSKRNESMNEFLVDSILISEKRARIQLSNKRTYNIFHGTSQKLNVNRNEEYQKIVGFGGSLTGSVSYLLDQLSQNLQDAIYKSYFHDDGIAYNMLRIPIGGCDFDLYPWAYNEEPRYDAQLSNFTQLKEEDELKILQIQRAKEITQRHKIKIMASAWSSPTWMKSNEGWTGFSYLKPEYYQTWANYHLKFLELMDAKNMPIWAITTGNEPLNGVVAWFFVHFMSLGWTPSNQAIWVSENLGPTIRNSKFKNVLIFSNDDQRYTYPAWFKKMNLSRSDSLQYLDGLAVHWYWDELLDPSIIDLTHYLLPEKLLLNTESCIGDKPWETHGPELGSWERGEKYARAYLQDLQHHFNGWIDWNLILDEQGGPNYVQNLVDAPIIVNTTNHKEFYKQPIYYAIGHFSKFIPENSTRIGLNLRSNSLTAIAFRRPDTTICLILLNSDSLTTSLTIEDSVRGSFQLEIPPKSLHTIIYK